MAFCTLLAQTFFASWIIYDAVIVCFKYKRHKLGLVFSIFATSWFLLCVYIVLFTKFWIAGLWTMFLPVLITSLFAAVGGWMQHFFLNPKNPRKWYSYDIINSFANTNGFNQGFHNVHHTLGIYTGQSYHWGFKHC